MRKRLALGCILAVSAVCLPQPAAGQQTGGDVAIGYSFLSNKELAANATNLPYGFFFGSSLQLTDGVSLAFDLNGHYRRGIEPSFEFSGGPNDPVVLSPGDQDFQAFNISRTESDYCSPRLSSNIPGYGLEGSLSPCEVHIQTIGVLAGPRFHLDAGGARPFFHALFGVSRGLRKIGFFSHTATHWAVQPGGGVDVDMTENTAFRIQADYRLTFFPTPNLSDPGSHASLLNVDGGDYRDFSFSIGVVAKLGSRRN